MKYDVDLMSGEFGRERTLFSREGIEANSPEDAIREAITPDTPGADWPVVGDVAKEPGGIRYWIASKVQTSTRKKVRLDVLITEHDDNTIDLKVLDYRGELFTEKKGLTIAQASTEIGGCAFEIAPVWAGLPGED